MQKPLLLFVLSLALTTATARAQGIQFFQGDLKALFAKAKAENKPVFVDVYTTWCGPCKLMAKNIFPDSAVGYFFNPRYISYKIDAEKGEGIAFAAQHKVAAYPTSLFLNPQGEAVFQHVGYEADKQKFIEIARTGLTEIASPENLVVMRRKLAAGASDTAFLYRYLAKLRRFQITGFEARTVAVSTLKALPAPARQDPKAMLPLALANLDGDSAVYEACLAVTPALKALAEGDTDLTYQLQNALLGANEAQLPAAARRGKAALQKRLQERRNIMLGAPGRDEASMAQDEAFMRVRLAQDHKRTEVLNPEVPAFVKKYWLSQTDSSLKIESTKQREEYRRSMEKYLAGQTTLSEEQKREMMAEAMSHDLARERLTGDLNSFAWAYYMMHRPAAEEKMAIVWMDFALKLRPAFANGWDTKAHLHEDLKQYPQAIEAERKAIAAAKAAEDDAEEYEANLSRFQEKLKKRK